jgi:galacturan 1,4-alpha-galacturonidase
MKQSTVQGLNVKNTPVQDFSINSSTDLTLDSIIIDNSAGNVTNGGHNTDAFDVGSSSGLLLRMRISRIRTIAWQSTLALTSHSPVVYAPVAMASASGPSVAAPITLSRTSTSVPHPSSNSDNGVRIKTVYGATGSVSGVTYKDITLNKIAKYGIAIEQNYENGSPTGTPTVGVPVTGLTIQNVKGTVASKGIDVYIVCAKGACSNWTWSSNSVTGGVKSSKCSNVPTGVSC